MPAVVDGDFLPVADRPKAHRGRLEDLLGVVVAIARAKVLAVAGHDALDALAVGIRSKKVNWVLDADIRGFFDAIDHEWLVKFIAHRIADRRVIRHIGKWLKAGIKEEVKLTKA